MNRLLRHLAPVSEAAWSEIDEEAKRSLKAMLVGRRIADFTGPLGDDVSSVSLGRLDAVDPPAGSKVEACVRRIQPLVEFRATFDMARSEIEAIDRGAKDHDF